MVKISIHAPRAGCDCRFLFHDKEVRISIHAPRAGCDSVAGIPEVSSKYFNPRTPCGVRLLQNPIGSNLEAFQSTHPVRGATEKITELTGITDISIHAPRAGCDNEHGIPVRDVVISIHAPRAGCDRSPAAYSSKIRHFNPRTPCGVRPVYGWVDADKVSISIHAPRAGCDHRGGCPYLSHRDFNPRTPCGVRLCIAYLAQNCTHFNPRTPCGVRPERCW